MGANVAGIAPRLPARITRPVASTSVRYFYLPLSLDGSGSVDLAGTGYWVSMFFALPHGSTQKAA